MHALALCPDLPTDVLCDISERLRDAADFVRFHAVCKAWRDAIPTTTVKQPSFLPWLLAPGFKDLKFRCVFSRTSYRAAPPSGHRNWVASADGAAIWNLVDGPCPILRDLLTGTVFTDLPPFPKEIKKWISKGTPSLDYDLSSIVYGDGTTLVYGLYPSDLHGDFRANFWAALLLPGEAMWTVVERTIELQSPEHGDFCAAYHRGKILVINGPNLCHVVTPDDYHGVRDVMVPSPWMPGERKDYICKYNYLLESHGELLWASVQVRKDYMNRLQHGEGEAVVSSLAAALSVSIHVLEEEAVPKKMRWVKKNGDSLANLVLFLGWPRSFAVDASSLGGDVVPGGCAYFIYHADDNISCESCCVFRYNLVDDRAKFMEELPHGWDDDMCMWLIPQPAIASIQEIGERREVSKWWKKKQHQTTRNPRSIIRIERLQQQHYKSYFSVIVHNLPHWVDNFQLRRFFGKHGKVYEAKVRCRRKTNISKGFGHVTMAMVEEQASALTTLDGLVLDGCILEVSLLKMMRQPEQHVNFVGWKEYILDHPIYLALTLLLFALVVLWTVEGYLIT